MQPLFKQEELLERVQQLTKSGGYDLSMEEDLSIAIMNLISLEEHFFFTAEKTGKSEYLELMSEAREIRKVLLARMIDEHEGETWCSSKHLLAAAMRLIEVGTKQKSSGKADEARKTFDLAYKAYSMFWALRLKLSAPAGLKQSNGEKPRTEQELISKLLDCCKE